MDLPSARSIKRETCRQLKRVIEALGHEYHRKKDEPIVPFKRRTLKRDSTLEHAVRIEEGLGAGFSTLHRILEVLHEEYLEANLARRRLQNEQNSAVKLPTELMTFIFELSCQEDVGFSECADVRNLYARFYQQRAAISLTCTHFRDVARQSSLLWNHAVTSLHGIRGLSDPYNLVALAFERSAGRNLSLYVQARAFQGDLLHELLTKYAAHCGVLWLALSTRVAIALTRGLLTDVCASGPIREFGLKMSVNSHDVPEMMPLDFSEGCTLRGLTISLSERGGATGHTITIIPPKVCNIRRLSLAGAALDISGIAALLNACADHLEMLNWDYEDDEGFAELDVRPAIRPLHQLQNLRVSGNVPIVFLERIDAPNLTRLHIEHFPFVGPSGFPLPVATQFPRLRYLVLGGAVSTMPLVAFLRAHHALEEVVLSQRLNGLLAQCFSEHSTSESTDPTPLLNLPNLTDVWTWLPKIRGERWRTLHERNLLASRVQYAPEQPFRLHIYVPEDLRAFTEPPEVQRLQEDFTGLVGLDLEPFYPRWGSTNIDWEGRFGPGY